MATNLPPPLTPALNFTIYEVAGYGELIGKPLTKQQILYQLTHYDETARPALVASAVVMLVISSFGVALRLFARRIKKVNLAADDWMAVTALVGTTVHFLWRLRQVLNDQIAPSSRICHIVLLWYALPPGHAAFAWCGNPENLTDDEFLLW